jgi:hypothetical protein
MKRRALNMAWVTMWKNASQGMLAPILNIITPSWLRVDRATIFLKSHSVVALKPAIRVVEVAIISIKVLNNGNR